jgi:hypothetical protein
MLQKNNKSIELSVNFFLHICHINVTRIMFNAQKRLRNAKKQQIS